jgi:hypothetical protein
MKAALAVVKAPREATAHVVLQTIAEDKSVIFVTTSHLRIIILP